MLYNRGIVSKEKRMVRYKDIEELNYKFEHLQERLDDLRDDFEYLENYLTIKIPKTFDDRFKALENYLNIEYNKELKINIYTEKQNKILTHDQKMEMQAGEVEE